MAAHISLFATKSLKAIDDWMSTCQANLTGTTRNAFKESTLMYGGGLVTIIKDPTIIEQGKMIAEQALTTGNTRLDWSDGTMVASTQASHFAIQGDGFFLLADPKDAAVAAQNTALDPNPLTPGAGLTFPNPLVKSWLARDGEFHFSVVPGIAAGEPVLVNSQGLLVLGDINDGTLPGNSDNDYHYITLRDFSIPNPGKTFPKTITVPSLATDTTLDVNNVANLAIGDTVNINNTILTITSIGVNQVTVSPGTPIALAIGDSVIFVQGPTNPNKPFFAARPSIIDPNLDKDFLKYSGFGSTIYQDSISPVGSYTTLVNGTSGLLDRPGYTAPASRAILREKTLESSNVRVASNIAEMAALGKVYNGFVQLIKVYNSSLDEVLGFIR